MKAADELAKHVGVKPACAALEVSRSTLYRRRGPSTGQQQPRPTPARALSETERGEVFDTLCSERFVDRSPAEVVATLLDEEVYLCSERTMYRVLASAGRSEVPVQERRAQRTHPEYKKPELMATAPNQVWSWDITRLLGPKKWSYYYLYVIMDIYSRYVVGWMVADRENSALAGRLIQQSCLKHGVQPRVLTLHSDRGAPMTSQCTAQLLADLGVTRSLSRPQVSDDNPFSEAQFKTLNPSLVSRTVRGSGPSLVATEPDGQVRGSGPSQDVLSIVLPLVQCRAPPWRHLDANPRAGPLRERRSGHRRQEIRAPRSMGRSSRTLRQRCAEAQTAPGGRLHQSSHPFPHHTGHCSLINPVECPIVVDRFRSAAAPADPEVVDRPLRRRFSPSYKLRIVEEADRCTEPGEVGQVLRREGLYSSHLTTWRKAAHSGSLKALSKKRGRKPERNPLDEKVRKLERRNARLENELRKAHLIIDVQGKVAGLLGISLDDGTNS